MNKAIISIILALAVAAGVQANTVFETDDSGLESAGYILFKSDSIKDTISRPDAGTDIQAYCAEGEESAAKSIGDLGTLRKDHRVPIGAKAKISYATACSTYLAVVERLQTANDARKLWLLFGDSVTDNYAAEMMKNAKENEDASAAIEMKRLATISEYIEFFTRNKDWKLSDYAFLSQAYKARKEKPLSPAFSMFISGLLTGDTEKALQAVNSVDLNYIGGRFSVPSGSKTKNVKKVKQADARH